jgi:hypothetical protein
MALNAPYLPRTPTDPGPLAGWEPRGCKRNFLAVKRNFLAVGDLSDWEVSSISRYEGGKRLFENFANFSSGEENT